VIAFSRLYFILKLECLLHSEHGCSVDAAQLMQLITVGCLVMGEEGSTAVCFVILCLRNSVPSTLSVVFMSHYVTSICLCDHQL